MFFSYRAGVLAKGSGMRRLSFRLFVLLFAAFFAFPVLAEHEAHSQPQVRVGIVLFDGVEIIDFAGPYEVFGTAGFGVVTLSPDGKPVKTAMGLTVTPDASFADAPTFDVLLVPGGDTGDAQKDPRILDFIRKHTDSSHYVLSVCTGAFILGSSGILDGLKATTFNPSIASLAKRYPKVDVIKDVRWADNGKVITSAGLSSGIDAALHVVARLHGLDQAKTVAMHLEYDWKSDGGFVRSRMADRYIPAELHDAVQWPKDMKIDQLSAFGDEAQWQARYHVSSATDAKGLLDRMSKGVNGISGWTREGNTYRWTRSQEGRHVTMQFQTTPGSSAKEYDLEVTIQTAAS
jgi:putative intracellular protease/amidase